MAKATFVLPNGTHVVVEGSTEEVKTLLVFYGSRAEGAVQGGDTKVKDRKAEKGQAPMKKGAATDTKIDLAELVNLVKTCKEAELIERNVLDRISQVDRTLLPMYIVHEHKNNAFGLTSGEISKITKDLGVTVLGPNASKTVSGTASKYVIGDVVRKPGQPVRYKLSRRGIQYMKAVITGKENEK